MRRWETYERDPEGSRRGASRRFLAPETRSRGRLPPTGTNETTQGSAGVPGDRCLGRLLHLPARLAESAATPEHPGRLRRVSADPHPGRTARGRDLDADALGPLAAPHHT